MKTLIPLIIMLLSLTAVAQKKPDCYTAVVNVWHTSADKAVLMLDSKTKFVTNIGDLQHGKDYIIYFVILKDDTPPVISIIRKVITKNQLQKDLNFEAEMIRNEFNVIKYKQ